MTSPFDAIEENSVFPMDTTEHIDSRDDVVDAVVPTSGANKKKKKKKQDVVEEFTVEDPSLLLEEEQALPALCPSPVKRKSRKQQKASELSPIASSEDPTAAVEADPSKKRSKKNDSATNKEDKQTWQEEESAQALLALNKGLGENEAQEDGEEGVALKKKRRKGKGKKTELSDETIVDSDTEVLPADEDVEMAEAALAATNAAAQLHAAGALDIADSMELQQQQPRESAEGLPDSQRVIMSEHLAAHMSKLAPPSQTPTQEPHEMVDDMMIEHRLAATLQQSFQHPMDEQTFTPVNENGDEMHHQSLDKAQKKRKRAVDNNNVVMSDQHGLMVDPQLMQLDEDAALAMGQLPTDKTKKRRRSAQENDEAGQQLEGEAAEASKKTGARRKPANEKKASWGTVTTNNGEAPNGGTFGVNERFAIDKALMDFSKENNMTMEQLGERVWGNNRPKDEFWDTICRAVPNRSRASVYKHVRRSCHIFQQRAKWTEEEDAELAALVAEKGNKWKDIGLAMHRMGEDCRDRYRNYVKCGKNRGTDRWSEEEEALLKATVASHKEIAKQVLIVEGKPLPPPETEDQVLINWTVVSDKMENKRSRIQCRYKWKKMIAQKERVQKAPVGITYEGGKRKRIAFSVDQMLPGDHYWLLKEIRDSGATQENEIPWDNIVKRDEGPSPGIWTHKDLKAAYKKLRANQPHTRRPLAEIVRVLLSELEANPALDINTRFNPTTCPERTFAPSTTGSNIPPISTNFTQRNAYEQPKQAAPIASMGTPTAEDSMALDPELMNQGGLHELEKTAGEAIAFSAALQSAARVARGAVQQQQQQQQQQEAQEAQQQAQEAQQLAQEAQKQAQQAELLLDEDDNERELRKQLGGFIQQQESGPV